MLSDKRVDSTGGLLPVPAGHRDAGDTGIERRCAGTVQSGESATGSRTSRCGIELTDSQEFGPLVRAMPMEQQEAQNQRSRELLRRALVDGEWSVYVTDLRQQGSLYAKIGVSFSGWYDIVRSFQRVIVPLLVESFRREPDRLSRAITSMLEFIDYVMATIAQQYLVTKEEVRFRLLVDFIRDYAIFMLGPQGNITSWNVGAQAIMAYDATEIIGKHFSIFYTAEERESGEPDRHLETAAGLGRFEDEGWRVRRDGTRIWVNTVITPLRDLTGRLLGFAKVTRDLTERKKAEDAIRKARDAAEIAKDDLEAFSYSVAHDLRAPLRAINGYSVALIEDLGQARRRGEGVSGEHQRGRGTDGAAHRRAPCPSRVSRADLASERVNLSEVAREVITQLRTADPARTVECVVADGLVASGDPQLFRVLMENLLGNAWKFASKREVARIEVGRVQDEGASAFFVRDNGAGFDMTYAQKLFAPFQRMHKAAEYAGTGIGLATVQRIVRRHGGTVWAEAAVERGATFHFTLDAAQGASHG